MKNAYERCNYHTRWELGDVVGNSDEHSGRLQMIIALDVHLQQ